MARVKKESATKVRLQRVLADAGIAARRVCERLIADGRVVVNGHKMTELPIFVDPAVDRITVDGKLIPPPQEKVYIMLHKPARTIVATADEPGLERRTAMHLVDHPARAWLFPVGRLDYDTTGLLLLTNDGEFANFVTHPSKGVTKVYHAWVKGHVNEETLAKIRRQSKLVAKAAIAEKRKNARQAMGSWAASELPSGKKKMPITPIDARVLRIDDGKTVLEVELIDNRAPLRDVLLAAGLDVRKLVRVRIGQLEMKTLQPGAWRELQPKEVRAMMRPDWHKRGEKGKISGKSAGKGGFGKESGRGGGKTPNAPAATAAVEQATQRALALLAGRGTSGQDATSKTATSVMGKNKRAAGNEAARLKAASESQNEPTRRKPRTLMPD